MKKFLLFALFLIAGTLPAQPTIQWQKSFGGSGYDGAYSIQQSTDGGFYVSGLTLSKDGDVSNAQGIHNFWVVKLTNNGSLVWQKALGGSNTDWLYTAQATSDKGCVLAGLTQSNDGDVSGNHGYKDAWVIKLDSTGYIQWQKCLGGSGWEESWSIRQTYDGGYVVAGTSSSNDGDVTGNHGGSLDFWVVKLDSDGVLEWQKSLGGNGTDIAYSIKQTSEGGYIVVGESESTDGDVTGNHGSSDFWVVKLNETGDIQWQKSLGSGSYDRPNEVHVTTDGGYVIVGEVTDSGGDVTGHHNAFDWWVVKLDSLGDIQWQKCLGGNDDEWGRSVQQTSDNGYVIAGTTRSNNGDVSDNDGGQDFWVVKLTPEGNIQWKKTLGGPQAESANSIQQTSEGGYVLAGYSWSNNGDVSGNHGEADFWVVKLTPESSPTSSPQAQSLEIYPNPATQSITLQIPSEAPTLSVSITDLLGRELNHQIIMNGTFGSSEMDISRLPGGFYLVSANTPDGKVYVGKLRKAE